MWIFTYTSLIMMCLLILHTKINYSIHKLYFLVVPLLMWKVVVLVRIEMIFLPIKFIWCFSEYKKNSVWNGGWVGKKRHGSGVSYTIYNHRPDALAKICSKLTQSIGTAAGTELSDLSLDQQAEKLQKMGPLDNA